MRKLIYTGVVTVFIVIAFIIYVKYDTKKFVQELSLETPPEQQANSTGKDATEASVDEVTNTEQTGFENTPKEILKDVGQFNELNADTESKVDDLDPVQTPAETKISPELKKVFSNYHNLYKKSEELSLVLGPLIMRSVELSQRLTVIGQELSAAKDEATRRKVLAEWDGIDKWTEEEGPRILELQDEASKLASERLRIINEYGFETERDFLRAHRNDYETWVSDESLTPLSIFRR